jgi:peroxidase
LDPYEGYNNTVNPTVDNFWFTSAFRYAHSEISSLILRSTETYVTIPEGDVLLRDCWGKCLDAGIEPILRGMSQNSQMEVDVALVDDLRNFFFDRSSKYSFDGSDLMAADIQRVFELLSGVLIDIGKRSWTPRL